MPLGILPIAALSAGAGLTAVLSFAGPALAAGEQTPPPARSIDRFCANVPQDFQPFTDVQGDTFEDHIECLAAAGVTNGGPGNLPDDQYGPALTVRRDAMASFIARLIDKADELDTGDEIQGLAPFDGTRDSTDVRSDNVHRESIDRLVEAGIVKGGPQGRPSNEYGPELEVSRAQMASFIVRALVHMTGENFETPSDYFVDDETTEPHEGNINAVAASAIAVGRGQDTYEPVSTVSRSQMAGFLTRTFVGLEDVGLITPARVAFAQNGTGTASRTSTAPGDVITCNGGRCDGTDDSDTLVASNSAEQVIGFGGDDDIELDAAFPSGSSDLGIGGPGRDCIDGGAGEDLMIGGPGDDNRPCEFTAFVDPQGGITGGPGNDRLEGGPGNDSMNGISDDDVLIGGSGDDLLRDTSPLDADRLFGGRGADTLDARDGDGDDLIDGGPGVDDCSGDRTDTFVNCERVTRL
jgi:hypothetical protein